MREKSLYEEAGYIVGFIQGVLDKNLSAEEKVKEIQAFLRKADESLRNNKGTSK